MFTIPNAPEPDVIERVETAKCSLGVTSISTLLDKAADVTIIKFNSKMTLDQYNSQWMRTFLATPFPQLMELTIVVNPTRPAVIDVDATMPRFEITPEQYPCLTKLRLDGIALSGTSLATVRHLELCNYPTRPGSTPLEWSAFSTLLNTASHVATLKFFQYLHHTNPDPRTMWLYSMPMPGSRPEWWANKIVLPSVQELAIQEGPSIISAVLPRMTIRASTTIKLTAISTHPPRPDVFCATISPLSRPIAAITEATLTFKANSVELSCVVPHSGVRFSIDYYCPSFLNGFSVQDVHTVCTAAGQFLGYTSVGSLHCVNMPLQTTSGAWANLLTNCRQLRELSVLHPRGVPSAIALHLFTALHILRDTYSAKRGMVPYYPQTLLKIAVRGPTYSDEVMQAVEVFVHSKDAQGQPCKWMDRLDLCLDGTIPSYRRQDFPPCQDAWKYWTPRLSEYVREVAMSQPAS
ncbi:hypothetical protein C8Q74DRAFT_1213654 [Fomes fomentarius]|nr:hypothetical protein C8Q74DRAFT_1213654 [Fomes fomentarius]